MSITLLSLPNQNSSIPNHSLPNQMSLPQSSSSQSSGYPSNLQSPQLDSGYSPTDKKIDDLANQVSLLAQQFRATLPQTNNQLRASSNPRNQATVEDERIVVQTVQGRQKMNQRNVAQGNVAAGNGGGM